MQSKWRVACVRIPRFPIGAVWQHAIAEGRKSIPRTGASPAADQQLLILLTPDTRTNGNGTAAPSRASEGSGKRTSGEINSSSKTRGQKPEARGNAAESRVTSHESQHWDDLPIALSDGLRVRAVTTAGARLRIRAGMTVTEATSRCADLEVFPWDQVVVDDEVRRATAAFLGASPQVTPVAGAPGMWWIGATGLETLGGEPALAKALLSLARRWHPGARVAIADSCVAARAGTWETSRPEARGQRPERGPTIHDSRFTIHPPSHESRVTSHAITILPPGSDALYLATAPVGLIPMDDAMAEALAALGIRQAGGLAVLPPDDVEQRWGHTGLMAWRLARGEDRRRPGLATTEYPRTVSADLVPSVELMEPVLFLVRAALDRLLAGLARRWARRRHAGDHPHARRRARGRHRGAIAHHDARSAPRSPRWRASCRCSSAVARCSTAGRSRPRCVA